MNSSFDPSAQISNLPLAPLRNQYIAVFKNGLLKISQKQPGEGNYLRILSEALIRFYCIQYS